MYNSKNHQAARRFASFVDLGERRLPEFRLTQEHLGSHQRLQRSAAGASGRVERRRFRAIPADRAAYGKLQVRAGRQAAKHHERQVLPLKSHGWRLAMLPFSRKTCHSGC